MRRFLNNRLSNYNNVGDKVDDFCEDCENRWLPFSRVWWDSTEKNIANIKRKDNGIFVIKKILSLINSISESIKDIYDRINAIEPPILSEKLIELENDYLEVGVTADDKQEDLNIAIYENYISLKNTKVDKPLIESTSDSLKIVALDNQGESVFIKSNELGKVKSVNNKIGDVILKTSDLENDSDYTTNLKLNQERDERISADNLKLDKPTTSGTTTTHPNIVGVDDLGNSAKLKASDFGKVKSVNGKEGDVILKTSDLENDSDYTTNATLTAHTSNKSNPHNVTKSQIGLGNVDNTSDLNKPISTATQTELNKKLDKPTTNNTPDYVLLADGSTAPKSDFGKVDTVMGVEPDANKNVDISGIETNWTNASHRWSNLPNKSADATYDKVMVLDADGKAGMKNLDFVPYTGANKPIDFNTKKITHNGIVSNVNSITSPWLINDRILTSNNKVAYLIIDGFTADTNRQLYIEVESIAGNGEYKRLVKGFIVNFTKNNIIDSLGDSRYLEVTGYDNGVRYGIGEVEKHSNTALKIPLIWISSLAISTNKISVKAYTGLLSNLTFRIEYDATSTLTTENPYLYRDASEKWVNQQINDGKLTLSTGTGLSGSGAFTSNQSGDSTFTVGIASTHVLPTTAQTTSWNNKQDAITGGATTIASSNLTVNRALISNASGKVVVSPTTSTELGYLSGVTSSIQTQLNSKINSSLIGANNGVASLDSNGKVLTTQLPSYVDDVIEASNLVALNALPSSEKQSGKIYVALDTNKTYRWSGSAFIYITSGAVDSVAGKTGVVTLVKGDVGLGNVDNTSDLNKPISTATQTELNKKLDKPTTNNTPEYVLLADGSTAPKSDFGKVDTVMGVQADASKNVDISGAAMNWTNASQRFSGLVDKSADATYNALMGLDSQGNAGKLTALGNVLESGLQTISSAQALRIGQLLNGGQGSSGAISVNLISPPIVQNRFDSVEYVLLMGANLLLNSTDMSISICDENKNVIQQIPNNQIINNSASELIFYYNFYQFATGTHYIKITSGVKVYYTTLDLRVVQEVENINFNEITWEKMYAENVTAPSVDEAINQNVIQRAVGANGNTTNVLSSFKSSELFALGENFSIEYMLMLNQATNYGAGATTARVFTGLGYSNTPNALINNSIIYHHVSGTYTNGNAIGINGSVYNTALVTPHNTIVTITKVGNLFRITIGSVTRSFTLSNNSGYSMFIQSNGSSKGLEQQIQITKAFKFN